MVFNEEKRKQKNKKEKLTESLNLTVKIARRSNDDMTLVSETSHKQNHCGNHKAALNENLPTLSLYSQFNFEDKGNFAVYDKDYRNV